MAYEVDYIPVGDGEKSGDAIALRFGNLSGTRNEQTVIVIDGGYKESGQKLVEHIKTYYHTDHVDLAISTHPDADHASGLTVVLEELIVTNLLMHKPWEHAADIKTLIKDKRITTRGLQAKFEKSLQHASDLEELSNQKGITIVEPFQGTTGYEGVLQVLGPSLDYYESLLPEFFETPGKSFQKAAIEIIKWVEDNLDIDLLDDDEDTTTPANNTSTVILFNIDGHKLLFTGDVGKTGLIYATDYAEKQGILLTNLNFLDVPHHGSRRNLSSKVLARVKAETSFISAPDGSPKHPAKRVTNALKKHGSKVYVNRSNTLRHHYKAPDRINWGTAKEEPFHTHVED